MKYLDAFISILITTIFAWWLLDSNMSDLRTTIIVLNYAIVSALFWLDRYVYRA